MALTDNLNQLGRTNHMGEDLSCDRPTMGLLSEATGEQVDVAW